jgi:outer membrane receptor protein involved in Fe transport
VGFPATFRGRASADWSRGPVSAGVSLNRISGSRDAADRKIDGQTTMDLRLRFTMAGTGSGRGLLDGVAAALSVRNVFDKAPPFYDNPLGFAYDAANADVIGRFIRLELSRSW